LLEEEEIGTNVLNVLREDSGEGGDVRIWRKEAPCSELGQMARKPLTRKLYSETGNGSKVLE